MSFPTTPVPSSIKIVSIQPTLVSVTHLLKRQARTRGGQRWAIEAAYPPLSREDFAPLFAFGIAQKGQYSTFTYIPPVYGNATGDVSACTSAVEVAGTEVVTVTMTGTLKAGDFVKFASHVKVYMVTADLTGSGELSIQPPLLEATTSASVTYDSVPFTMAFSTDIQSFDRGVPDLHSYKISLVEVV
jgi:hypothetical protein